MIVPKKKFYFISSINYHIVNMLNWRIKSSIRMNRVAVWNNLACSEIRLKCLSQGCSGGLGDMAEKDWAH